MLRRPTSFRQLRAEAKVVEMLDPIVTSDSSDDDDEEERAGPFHFMLSIIMFKYQLACVFFRESALVTLWYF